MATLPINPIYLDADDPKLGASWFGATDYKFATGRLRSPSSLGTATAALQYTGHKQCFLSPPYWTNNYRFAFPGHYTRDDGVQPSEIIMPNSYVLNGFSMLALINGTWVTKVSHGNANPVTVEPGAGYLCPDIVFPGRGIPPLTKLEIVSRINITTGQKLPCATKNRSGTNEGSSQTVATSDFFLTKTGLLGGTDGRFSGEAFAPSYGIAKTTEGITRPVFWVNGDSIAFGKNESENILCDPTTGAMGFLARALEDDTRSRRMAFYNSAIAGVGPLEQGTLTGAQSREGWKYKLDLIRLAPNRPYTHIITEHYNNSTGGDYETGFKPMMKRYYAVLKAESEFWGGTAAPIYQTRVLPRPGSTDWGTTLAGQGSTGENYGSPAVNRWLFDAELEAGGVYTELSGTICVGQRYANDQRRANGGLDRVRPPTYASTLATALKSGEQFINVRHRPDDASYVVINPGVTNAARHVNSIVDNGNGTFRLNLESTVASNLPVGTPVKTSLGGDSLLLHPNTPGHKTISLDVMDWKNNQFPWVF